MRPPNRFLLASVANLSLTANALRPFTRRGPGSVAAFALGQPLSELPLQTSLIQASLAALAARGGGTRGVRGRVAAAANLASALGLVQLHRLAARSESVLEAALLEGLGSNYRDRIAEPFRARSDSAVSVRSVIAPDFGSRKRYRQAKDLSYGEHDRWNFVDVWRRADLSDHGKAPVLLQVHGGGWRTGRKEAQAEPLMAHLASRGWVCATINYRLSPKATWPDHIVDVKRALAWTKATIAEHGGDPDFVVITGGSAGGHLCALAALTSGTGEFQPGFEDADTSVAAAVPFYGVYDLTGRCVPMGSGMTKLLAEKVMKSTLADDRASWEKASPLTHVGSDAPPFFVLHGSNDSLVSIDQSQAFVDVLRASSSHPVVYAELPGAQHAHDGYPSVRTHHVVRAVERFLAVVRSDHARSATVRRADTRVET
jgi:acetyl esterase/lipase